MHLLRAPYYSIFGYYIDQLHYAKILRRLEVEQFDEIVRLIGGYIDIGPLNIAIKRIDYGGLNLVVGSNPVKNTVDLGDTTIAGDATRILGRWLVYVEF
jgi:hypothetical protein